MNDDRRKRVESLLSKAVEVAPDRREAYLAEACRGDEQLVSEIRALLDQDAGHAAVAGSTDPHLAPTVEHAVTVPPEEMVGRRVGSYEILRRIGQGGMGTVFQAVRKSEFTSTVAVKLIRRSAHSLDLVRRFRDEIQFQAALGKHPYIARLLDAGQTDDGLPYFVMEYVDGLRIDRYCDQNCLTTHERLRLFRKICSAVQFAHQHTVIHRDLKPSNILIASDGTPKLIDFGLAKLIHPELGFQDAERTQTAQRVLTPDYASPEQARGERLSTGSDVYSLGVVLYELLTGRRPYRVDTRWPDKLARIIAEEIPLRPSDIVSRQENISTADGQGSTVTPESISGSRAVPVPKLRRLLRGDLDNIVLTALRKEPQRRYASAEQFSADIERFLTGMPVLARPDSWTYRARKFVNRNKSGVAATVLILATLLAGIVGTTTQWRRAEAEARRAEVEAETAQAVAGFLNDLLASANPSELGRDVTVRDAVDAAAERIDAALAEQPAVEAAVRRTLGVTYRGLSELEQAERQLRRALEIYQSIEGPEGPETLVTMDKLAGVLRSQKQESDLAEAAELRRHVLDVRTRMDGPDHPDTVAIMGNLANVLSEQGEHEEALVMYRRAGDVMLRTLGPRASDTLATRSNAAIALWELNRLDEAQSELREVQAALRSKDGTRTPRFLNVSNLLAGVLTDQGSYDEAERIYRDTLEGRAQVLGEDHLHTLSTMRRLTRLLVNRKSYSAAVPLLQRCLQIHEDRFHRSEGLTFGVRSYLARALTGLERYDDAELVLMDNYKHMSEERGADSRYTREAAEALAEFYEQWGKPEKAESFRQRVR